MNAIFIICDTVQLWTQLKCSNSNHVRMSFTKVSHNHSPLLCHPILPSHVFVSLSPGRRCPPPGMLRLHSSSDKCLFIIPSSTETPAPQGLPRVPPRGSLAHSSLCAPKRPGPLLPTCPSQNFTVLFLIALWTNDSNSTHCTF